MPFYQAMGCGGGGWAATSASTTTSSSYLNPFYGATGGTGTCATTTNDWNTAETGSTVVWVNAIVTTPDGWEQEYEQHRQAQAAAYQPEMIAAQQQAIRANIDERRAALERTMAARQQEIAEYEQKRKSAHDRAKELLLGKLTPVQREAFIKNGFFVVEGGRTKTKYRIRSNSYAGNIDVLNDANNIIYRLCVHCAGDIPLEDHLLAQKTMLELAEDDIVRLANRHAA